MGNFSQLKSKKISPKKVHSPSFLTTYFPKASQNILRESQSLNAPDIYSLGCQESFHLSISEQQSRALNLVWALYKKRKIRKNIGVSIVGAGVAGCTAAIAMAMLGAKVTLFESEHEILPRFKNSSHRWIHPNYFSQGLFVDDWTDFPILNWRADTAKNMRELFALKFHRYIDKMEGELEINWGSNVVGIGLEYHPEFYEPISTLYWMKKNSPQDQLYSESFDINILAVGFGNDERRQVVRLEKPIITPSYWKKNSLHKNIKGKKNPKILISGCGDGGLVELFNVSLNDFIHSEIRKFIPGLPSLAVQQLEQSHQHFYEELEKLNNLKNHEFYEAVHFSQGSIGNDLQEFKRREVLRLNGEMAASYRYFAEQVNKLQPEFMRAFKSRIKKKQKVILNSRSETPYNPFTSIWNQMLLSLLEFNGAFTYLQGEIQSVGRSRKGQYTVSFGKGLGSQSENTRRNVDVVVQRYGQKSDFSGTFGNIIFNPLIQGMKSNHDSERLILGDLSRAFERKHRILIEDTERVESIHHWYERRDRQVTYGNIFSFCDYGNLFAGKRSAKELSKKLITFASKCGKYDYIACVIGNAKFDDEFLLTFEKETTRNWNINYPRALVLADSEKLKSHANPDKIMRLMTVPINYHDDYLKIARIHLANPD